MKKSRAKKAGYNIIVLAFYQLTIFVCNMILPKMILSTYGSEYNGLVSSITQFLNYISILRMGVAGATRVELYKSLGTDDINKTSEIVKATDIFMRKISVAFVFYLIALAIGFPLIIDVNFSFIEVSSLVVVIGIGIFAQYFFGFTYSTLLQADQKLYIYNLIQIFATIANTIIACIMIKLGFSIQIVKLMTSLIFTITPILLSIYVRKKYNINKNVKPDNTALSKRGDVVAHSIANIIHDNTDVTVLTLFAGVKVVSVYSVYHLILHGLNQLMSIFTSGLESLFGDMWVKKEYNNISLGLKVYELFMASFIIIVFGCTINLIIPFVSIYTKGVNDIEYVLPIYAFLALLSQILYCLRMPYLTIVQAAGKYKETKNGAFIEAFLNLSISIVLVFKVGIYGVIIGTIFANAFRTIQYYIFVSKNISPLKISDFIKRMIWMVLNLFIIYILFNYTIDLINISINTWMNWIISGIISFMISCFVLFVSSTIFYRTELNKLFIFIKRKVMKNG